MNEQIQKAIDQAEYTKVDLDNNCIGIRLIIDEGKFYMHTKKELLSLLKLVAEDAHLDGRSVYIKNRDISADKIQITCEHPTFEDYWKTLTEQL